MKKGVFILITVLFSIIVTGCESKFIYNNANQLKKEDAIQYKMEKTKVESIGKININTNIADVEIIEDDDFYVEIDYYYWEREPDYSLEEGVLYFDDSGVFPNSYSISFNLSNSIKIYIPKGSKFDSMRIQTSSGDVFMESFSTDKLDLEVSYGDLQINNAAALKTDIRLSSGKSEVKDLNVETLEYKNAYGNAVFTNINSEDIKLGESTTFDSIEISMSSGNGTLSNVTCNSLEIDNSYGDITCKELNLTELDADLSSGNLTVTKSTIEDIDVKNSYGDVSLSLQGNEADYTLDLDTSYGKIEVEGKTYEGHLIRENNGTKYITTNLSSGDIEVKFQP
jgi:DUF4097 and DUF4098 domain-containing protein YvlB